MTRNESLALGLLVLSAVAARAWRLDQPIVENYVGRQVPTAMVARNLDRGSGFGRPALDTGPFPNLFLVEPPVYASLAVLLRRASGLALEPAGRLVSALAAGLGAWGLYGLVRRREGPRVALPAVAAFAVLPVTLRYGRAFQPDMLMLGTLVAGLRCWDEREAGGGRGWLAAAWALTATGLAVKVLSAYYIALWVAVARPGRRARALVVASTCLIPAALWYAHAAGALGGTKGSAASAENAAIWARVLASPALLDPRTYAVAGRFFLVRSFTPLAVLAVAGAVLGAGRAGAGGGRLWAAWWAAAGLTLMALAGKLHHEYYLLGLAPPIAIGFGRLFGRVEARCGRALAAGAGAMAVGLSLWQTSATWTTPRAWADLAAAAREIRGRVPERAWVIAPEAMLYAADARGCRLEWEPSSAARAAREWGGTLDKGDAIDLVEFYRLRGARYVADLTAGDDSSRRRALHEAIRRRYRVRVDASGVLIAELTAPKRGGHAQR